jgi:transglutaminase-like putative cysteine protease
MRFLVHHRTRYRYSAPVRLGPHLLRFNPRGDGVTVLSRSLIVAPEPVGWREVVDRFGNPVTELEFEGTSTQLCIDSTFDLETAAPPPVDGHATPDLPWSALDADLTVYLDAESTIDPTVKSFARDLAEASGWSARGFLERLNRTLHDRTRHHIRHGGFAQAPAVTLATGAGACRDTAMLFIAAARALGIPARFVSGYQARAETADGGRHLHAWPEVHLPGLGWRGYDPTHGLDVEDGHVALCAAPDQVGTMPLEGGFWGDGVTSTLDYVVRIEAEE